MSKEGITVSTDVLGVMANPVEVQTLYKNAGFKCDLEVIAMPFQYDYLNKLSRGHNVNFDLGGIHGQLGCKLAPNPNFTDIANWLKIRMADALLPKVMGWTEFLPTIPTGMRIEIIASILERDIYFNVHNNTVANNFSDHQTYANFASFSHLTIENGTSDGDISKTVDLIHKLQDGGAVRTTGTFDLVHSVIALSDGGVDMHSTTKSWAKVLDGITDEFQHLHFPIGINDDSLPIIERSEKRKC